MFSSRFRNQQKAAEQKKALLEKMKARLATKKQGADAPVREPASELQASLVEEATVKQPPVAPTALIEFGSAKVRLYQDHADTPLIAAEPLERLVNLYLKAAQEKSAHLALMWPVAPMALPLVHVLATMECWSAGKKAGIRGLYFPAKENTFHPLNHLDLDQADLLRHAQALGQQKCVSDKDPVLFRAANENGALPTINDLIPHFALLEAGAKWQPYGEHLLERTLKKVNRYTAKAALRNNCAVLGAPESAPDALFAFGYQLDRDSLKECFRRLKRVGSPDVCLVNATRALRLNVPNWQGLLKQFFGAYLDAYPVERPGLVVLTDDPGVSFRIRELIEKEVERATRHRADTAPLRAAFHPIMCQSGGMLGECLKPEGEAEPTAPLPRKFRVEIRDADAARIVKTLYGIRNELALDEQAAKPLNEAANFLHRLAALPAGTRDIEAWLDECQADAGLRRKMSWLTPRGGLVEFIARGQAKSLLPKLEAALTAADRLVLNYFEATPMALALSSEVAQCTGSTHRLAMVFTRRMYLLLAERFLRRQWYPQGRSYDDFSPHLQFVLTKQLASHARSGWASRYVFAGIDDDALRVLMTEDGIPADSLLLLTQRTALYVRWSLKPIYDQTEFKPFKPRLEHILRHLESRLSEQDVPLLRTDDFVLPVFDFSSTGQTRDDDPEAWRIVLDDAEPCFRSPTASVYVYDPLDDLQSKSGFTPREVKSLGTGDQLFVMSSELREQVEQVLQRAGVPIEHDKPFEQTLRTYHETVRRRLDATFPGPSLTAQVTALRAALLARYPDLEKEFGNLRHWVNLGHAPDTPFDQLRPQAPRHLKAFEAVMAVLGIPAPEAAFFWQAAIHPIRVNRRADGRYVSDVYTRILFDPESAIVHAKLSQADIAGLFAEARRNVHTVVAVQPPSASPPTT